MTLQIQKQAQTKVEGTKTWKDNNATDKSNNNKVDLLTKR